jgi:histidinol-phosphate/aromatic aminotransferase/cobyric acid decarboxylase-like protein
MLEVCRALAGSALLVLDEAYIEFSGRASLASRLAEFPNLVLLRTLSKAYALAGARCGTLLASPDIVALLARIIPPYALPASTVEAVIELTAGPQRAQAVARVHTLLEERERMRARLTALPCVRRILPSDANFLLVEFRDAQAALASARLVGLLVRDFNAHPQLRGCLRLTVGTPEQNARLLAALEGT